MTRLRWRAPVCACCLALLSCGPYANIGEKLDVGVQIPDGQTWISGNADGTNINYLVVGNSSGNNPAPFFFVSEQFATTAGNSAQGMQGTWVNDGTTASFSVNYEYNAPDESGTAPIYRVGNTRTAENNLTIETPITKSGSTLVLGGSSALAGTYVDYATAVAALPTDAESQAACVAEISILAMNAMYLRVIGFGGVELTQYQSPTTFLGTISGSATVQEVGYAANTTTVDFGELSELTGTVLNGAQITNSNIDGDGSMTGSFAVTITPSDSTGTPLSPIVATVYFDGNGNPSNAIQITGGEASGGYYISVVQGGGTASLSPVPPPSPSLTDCLSLPQQ